MPTDQFIDPSQVQWDQGATPGVPASSAVAFQPSPSAPTTAASPDPSQVKWDDATPAPSSTPFQDLWSVPPWTHAASQVGKAAANTVAALPLVAMDAGVATRNIAGDLYNKAVGNPATPDYEMPSDMWHQSMDQIFGAPRNTAEKVEGAVAPIVMGAGAGALTEAPGAVGTIAKAVSGIPDSGVPPNFVSGADQKRQLLSQTVKNGQDLGLVVPPQTSNPNFGNWTAETIAGKIATQQGASLRNQAAANRAVTQDLTNAGAQGLNPDVPLTQGALRSVISDAGQGYQALRNVGTINTDDQYLNTLTDVAAKASGPAASFPGSKPSPLIDEVNTLLQPSFDASHAVDKIAQLRDASSAAYRNGESQVGSGYRQLSNALENQIDRGISSNPNVPPDVVQNFRNSRVLAAKAHTALDALNTSTGDISIRSLANSEDPLTGNMKAVADFGRAFPRATQDPSKIGSSGTSHLDMLGPLLTGGIGEQLAHGPAGLAAGIGYPLVRMGAKAAALGPMQSRALPAAVSAGSPKTAAAALQVAPQGAQPDNQNTTGRASGGKVDHDALVGRLMDRWHAARKVAKKTTEPLLSVPDPVVAKALEIAARPRA